MGNRMEGKSVIVTGGSKGLGRGIAQVFAREGGKVLIVARQPEAGERSVKEIADEGGEASYFRADVSDWDDVQSMARAAVDRHGGVDVLCCNAGIFPSTRLEDITPEEWDTVSSVNLKGTFLSIKACLSELKKSDQGRDLVDVFYYRANYRVSGLDTLWRDQGRPIGIHAYGCGRARQGHHNDQRRHARKTS